MTNIVMITRNRHRLFSQTLRSLYLNTDKADFNLTVVDDGSDDFRTLNMLVDLAEAQPNFSWLRLMNSDHVLSKAKNIGVAWSEQYFGRGDFLYLSDNDIYFLPGWLDKLTAFAKSTFLRGFRLWGGQIHSYHKPHPNSAFEQLTLDGDLLTKLARYDVLDGPSWLMHWSAWDDFGPLDRLTASGPCQSEEYRFCGGIRNSGLHIGVIDPHVVIHTGLTHLDGKQSPPTGYPKMSGVLYE